MRNCIPDELFNLIPFDHPTGSCEAVSLRPFFEEAIYKLPNVKDVVIEREFWHTMCEFAERTGLLLEKAEITEGNTLDIAPEFGRFIRVVGASGLQSVSEEGHVVFAQNGANHVIFSVAPMLTMGQGDTAAASHIAPKWFAEKYQKEIMDGAMMRINALCGNAGEARMYATAYNADILRCTRGRLTSGMRKYIEIDVEDVLARMSTTTSTNQTTQTVG